MELKLGFRNIIYCIKKIYSISKLYVFVIISSALVTTILKIFMIYFVKFIVDAIEDKNVNFLMLILFIGFIFYFTINISNSFITIKFFPIISNKIDKCLREELYQSYLKTEDFKDSKKYDLYFFAIQNLNVYTDSLEQISTCITNLFSIIGLFFIFINYDILTVFITIATVIFSFVASLKKQKVIYTVDIESIRADREVDYINRLMYIPDYSKEIHMNESSMFISFLREAYKKMIDIYKKYSTRLFILDFFISFSNPIFSLLMFMILGFKAMNHIITISTFVMLFNGSQQFLNEFNSLFMTVPKLYLLSLQFDKIKEFEQFSKNNHQKKISLHKVESIVFRNVAYTYTDEKTDSKLVLKNININISNKPQKIAIIGKNGSGKSTFLDLLIGLIKPSSGDIYINGININDIELNSLQSNFATVFQDFILFSFSIAQNIASKIDIDKKDEKMIRLSLEKVGILQKIDKFPNGIHSKISSEIYDDGEGFSRGELQKLAMARAYMLNRDFIVLDEPYSFADNSYREGIKNIIEELSKTKVVIIVTHDYSYLNDMNKVYLLENGELKEC